MTAQALRVGDRAKGPPSSPDLDSLFARYCGTSLFRPASAPVTSDNPYRRPLANREFDRLTPAGARWRSLGSNWSLVANRTLMSVYERDLVFLPQADLDAKREDFLAFYDDDLRLAGEPLRSFLERELFDFLDDVVALKGEWTIESFTDYFDDFRTTFDGARHAELMDDIVAAERPPAAATSYLVQLAGDFLVESSGMARHALGNFGPLQSELFKVIIDECGYGVHTTKHSTLFQRVLLSNGLDPTPHAYWQFYLPTSLFLNNYYSGICRDHRRLFRYFGALLQVETVFGTTCSQMAAMVRSVWGPDAETDYFTEHVHIDRHHSRMMLENIVLPAAEQHGSWVLHEVLRGFETSRVVGDLFVAGVKAQLRWENELAPLARSDSFVITSTFDGDRSHTRDWDWEGTVAADTDRIYKVRRGDVWLVAGLGTVVPIEGESPLVRRGALHGLLLSPGAEYEVVPVAAPTWGRA